MLKKIIKNKFSILVAMLAFAFLVLIRMYENVLFYDPLLNYFKTDYSQLPFPAIDNWRLFLGLLLRYFLNFIFAVIIIYAMFKDKVVLQFILVLYLVFFVILIFGFFFMLQHDGLQAKILLFYIRRFLIQPLFLLLFIPAIYYQRLGQK